MTAFPPNLTIRAGSHGPHAGPPAGPDDLCMCAMEYESVADLLPRTPAGRVSFARRQWVRALPGIQAKWTDRPRGHADPLDAACRAINDGPWSSDTARTDGCAPLVGLVPRDGWLDGYTDGTIRVILPLALRAAARVHPDAEHREALEAAAGRCELEGARAARGAARGTQDAAQDAARDAILHVSVALLIASHRTDRPWEDPEVLVAVEAVQHG